MRAISRLGAMRRRAESRMRGACLIERATGTTTDEWGAVVSTWATIYEGKGYARYPGLAFEQNHESGGADITVSRVVYRIPFGAVIRPGDRLTITADADNPQLAGTVLRVASVDDQSQATAQRLVCDDYQAGVA